MIKKNTIINELRNINYQFLVNDRNGMKIDNKNYIFKNGKLPILFSAPNAVKQFREFNVKPSDYLTGPLAIYMANIFDCSYFVRVCNDYDDPNYPVGITLANINNTYLINLNKFIKQSRPFLLIDIHGCRDDKEYDCSMWSDNYNTCDYQIISIFEKNFIKYNLSVDNGSEYLGGQVTRQCSMFTNAFQIEIKRKIRTLKLENYYLLESFIESMGNSIYETCEYSRKLKKVKK